VNDEQVIVYLRSRARVEPPVDAVSAVMRAVRAAEPARFSPLLGVVVAAAAVALVAIGLSLLGGSRVGPPGPAECETDAAGVLERAIEQLEATEGYRWTEEEQVWTFDPSVPVSADNPVYAWSGWVAEGAYRAPDLMRVEVTETDDPDRPGGPLGFERVLHIGGHAYGGPASSEVDGEPIGYDWWRFPDAAGIPANRLRGAFADPEALSGLDVVPAWEWWELPGEGGCEIRLGRDFDDGGEGGDGVVIAVRVGDGGRIVAGVMEQVRRGATEEDRIGAIRWRFEVTYDVPDASEFSPPRGTISTPEPEP
jgi:hypothetical protein